MQFYSEEKADTDTQMQRYYINYSSHDNDSMASGISYSSPGEERQLNRLVKMKEITEKINQELQTINEEEEQLKQFSEALIKLGNEIKTTVMS